MPAETFTFDEAATIADEEGYCWMSAVWLMATNIARAFALYGWCARIRGVEEGGIVEGLPVHVGRSAQGKTAVIRAAVEVGLDSLQDHQLDRLGLLPFLGFQRGPHTDRAVVLGAASLHRPHEYDNPDASTAALLSARLPYVFAMSRFAHHISCIVAREIGRLTEDRTGLQQYLQHWINQYVETDPVILSKAANAQKPLGLAAVLVEDSSGTGSYRIQLRILPCFQFPFPLPFPMRAVLRPPTVSDRNY